MGPTASKNLRPTGEPTCQDVGNIVHLEHINLNVPDQTLAAIFYRRGLGLTIDDPKDRERSEEELSSTRQIWYNIGRQQFHIIKEPEAQVLAGRIHLYTPKLQALLSRLAAVAPRLAGTRFAFGQLIPSKEDLPSCFEVTCPWGNKFVVWGSNPVAGAQMDTGIACIEVRCARGAGAHIQAFYAEVLGARAHHRAEGRQGGMFAGQAGCDVSVGPATLLAFCEHEDGPEEYTGWHVALYVVNFSESFNATERRGLILNDHPYADKCNNLEEALVNSQFRFQDICGPDGTLVIRFQHEVRSMYHPRYMLPLFQN
uniref:VOC domain-containing protein n=1 Tax=Pyramimonas obovata TaxID=1411642 RepID=A0A7S0RHK1_9CHLO|mmetsp:Transcript_34528/g.75492  ORF Transcript_34528/g.75492 Transcript_34528/m.75492 type:complete len:313 (+) Transcript_34528:397-1335(+)|eukprot:CAMPEP_0118958156 /NCGR_PEP_ID=MMETSP1169-20130426/62475_1 /TAXON_ID=36882 /ORGANISM="Pyramimonas obovata, Strain CCMP722" /LENGTH=312 /DNA_ID=CAMNT_0006906265 /DNA_START=491 /DNA_END=1429 /DNA_ORIENTATION=-